MANPIYDTRGNIIQLGNTSSSNMMNFGYDGANRLAMLKQNFGDDIFIQYFRDAQGRVYERSQEGALVPTSDMYFGYTGAGDTPDYMMNSTETTILEKYLQLPGGVVLTVGSGTTRTYSLPNVHGDVFATVNSTGGSLATFKYDPFGKLIGTTAPANIGASGATMGWEGQSEKLAETKFANNVIDMGARTYIPSLGRFAQADPTEGGVENNYVYPPDPVNDEDLGGEFSWSWRASINKVTKIASVGSMLPGPIGMIASGVAAAGYLSQGKYKQAAMYTAGIALAAVGAGAAVKMSGILIPRMIKGAGAARNLGEKLAIREAMGGSGVRITRGLNDPRLIGRMWDKYQYKHGDVVVHYIQNRYLTVLKRQFKIVKR